MEDQKNTQPTPQQQQPPKKSKLKKVGMVILVIFALAGFGSIFGDKDNVSQEPTVTTQEQTQVKNNAEEEAFKEVYGNIVKSVNENLSDYSPVYPYDAEQDIVTIKLITTDGTAAGLYAKNTSVLEKWYIARSAMEKASANWHQDFLDAGYETDVMFVYYSDLDNSTELLSVGNGYVLYDVADD